jgi:hypothetical protein
MQPPANEEPRPNPFDATMQLTLVSHYGEKPSEFAAMIRELQDRVSVSLGESFHPYAVEQVHGTIIGLECTSMDGAVCCENFLRLRHEHRAFDFGAMLNYLRQLSGFDLQVGGFRSNKDYGFLSQNQSPFIRSFSIQRETAVAMGWPVEGANFPRALDGLRRALEPFGALRKWAWREGEVDNDFYFVLGRVIGSLADSNRQEIERRLREQLASLKPLTLRISPASLAFIAYSDLRLPLETSRVFNVNDPKTTAELLASAYD